MTPDEETVMTVLQGKDGMTSKAISDATGIRQSRITKMMKSLERYGFVEKDVRRRFGHMAFTWRVKQ